MSIKINLNEFLGADKPTDNKNVPPHCLSCGSELKVTFFGKIYLMECSTCGCKFVGELWDKPTENKSCSNCRYGAVDCPFAGNECLSPISQKWQPIEVDKPIDWFSSNEIRHAGLLIDDKNVKE